MTRMPLSKDLGAGKPQFATPGRVEIRSPEAAIIGRLTHSSAPSTAIFLTKGRPAPSKGRTS
ncbi:hypothetical protein MASR1M49_03300 [Pararhodobacter aggregans]